MVYFKIRETKNEQIFLEGLKLNFKNFREIKKKYILPPFLKLFFNLYPLGPCVDHVFSLASLCFSARG